MKSALTLAITLCATPALADLTVTFDEGAPKDRFTVANTGDCVAPAAALTIDLAGSAAGLIFDVTSSGAGVEVFQPFEVVAGAELMTDQPTVSDGDNAVTLNLLPLAPDQSVAFTIDVDDTIGQREITVSRAEITGAQVLRGADIGVFDDSATATVILPACAS